MQNYVYYPYFDKKKNCNAIKAVTTYDFQTLTGIAYLHPTDSYDEEFGKKLAHMRCKRKVLKRKLSASKRRIREDSKYLLYILEKVEQVKKELEKSERIKAETEAAIKSIDDEINEVAQNY